MLIILSLVLIFTSWALSKPELTLLSTYSKVAIVFLSSLRARLNLYSSLRVLDRDSFCKSSRALIFTVLSQSWRSAGMFLCFFITLSLYMIYAFRSSRSSVSRTRFLFYSFSRVISLMSWYRSFSSTFFFFSYSWTLFSATFYLCSICRSLSRIDFVWFSFISRNLDILFFSRWISNANWSSGANVLELNLLSRGAIRDLLCLCS